MELPLSRLNSGGKCDTSYTSPSATSQESGVILKPTDLGVSLVFDPEVLWRRSNKMARQAREVKGGKIFEELKMTILTASRLVIPSHPPIHPSIPPV